MKRLNLDAIAIDAAKKTVVANTVLGSVMDELKLICSQCDALIKAVSSPATAKK